MKSLTALILLAFVFVPQTASFAIPYGGGGGISSYGGPAGYGQWPDSDINQALPFGGGYNSEFGGGITYPGSSIYSPGVGAWGAPGIGGGLYPPYPINSGSPFGGQFGYPQIVPPSPIGSYFNPSIPSSVIPSGAGDLSSFSYGSGSYGIPGISSIGTPSSGFNLPGVSSIGSPTASVGVPGISSITAHGGSANIPGLSSINSPPLVSRRNID